MRWLFDRNWIMDKNKGDDLIWSYGIFFAITWIQWKSKFFYVFWFFIASLGFIIPSWVSTYYNDWILLLQSKLQKLWTHILHNNLHEVLGALLYIFIYTYYQEPMKSRLVSHCNFSLLLMMKEMTVWHFLVDFGKAMIALIIVLYVQFHKFSYFSTHTICKI